MTKTRSPPEPAHEFADSLPKPQVTFVSDHVNSSGLSVDAEPIHKLRTLLRPGIGYAISLIRLPRRWIEFGLRLPGLLLCLAMHHGGRFLSELAGWARRETTTDSGLAAEKNSKAKGGANGDHSAPGPESATASWDASATVTLDLSTIALDLETYPVAALGGGKADKNGALDPYNGNVRLLTYLEGGGSEPVVVDLLSNGVSSQLPAELAERLCGAELIIHNAPFDLRFLLARLGIMPKAVWCTMTASRLLDPGKPIHGLAQVLERYLGVKIAKTEGRSNWSALPLAPEQLKYASDDVRHLPALREKLENALGDARLTQVFELEMRLIPVVARMEAQGFAIDVDKLRAVQLPLAREADRLAAELRVGLGNPTLDLESPDQLVSALKAVGIDIPNTHENTLAARSEPLVKLLRRYRRPVSLVSYIGALLAAQHEGRIHAAYSSTGAANGRFSCERPNLQNVPRDRGTALMLRPFGTRPAARRGRLQPDRTAHCRRHHQGPAYHRGFPRRRGSPAAGAPVLLLFDEVLNYLNRYRAGAESFHAFIQNLTVATTGTTLGACVISLPRSQVEMTEWDQEWQDKIAKVVRRVAKDLIANDETEISEVVRRRLFQDLGSEKARRNVARAFGDWCFERRAQLPPEWTAVDSAATEAKAREFLQRRFEACYPFHPATLSVFQRKWQSLMQYQQTRGTLAMLAQWISLAAQDAFRKARTEPLITLGSAPLGEPGFRSVMLGQLGESRLVAAIDTDIAGEQAHSKALDADTMGPLGDIHRRVGTAILFESSGGQTEKVAHLPELRFALGEPELDTTSIDNAAFALEDRSYFVRKAGSDGFRIGYQPTMKKVVSDRRASLDDETEVKPAIRKLAEEEFRRAASIPVVAFPREGAEIPDTPRLTLVVADPESEWTAGGPLRSQIAEWTKNRGKSPRLYPGALVWCLKKPGRISATRSRWRSHGSAWRARLRMAPSAGSSTATTARTCRPR